MRGWWPGAAPRNSRKRYAGATRPTVADQHRHALAGERKVEARDLAIYETLFQATPEALREAA